MNYIKYYGMKYKVYIILIILFLIIKLVFFSGSSYYSEYDYSVSISSSIDDISSVVVQELYAIDIKGEVNSPGVYYVSDDLRVIDVIALAGGETDNADLSCVNLSQRVNDEMVIIIPSDCSGVDLTLSSGNSLININTASSSELESLPGIGSSRANDIIKYRDENNGFNSIDEIMNVSGIGESTYENIKDSITI